MVQQTDVQEKVLFDFGSAQSLRAWRVINDVVMGGRSSSQIIAGPQGIAVFTGIVSLENHGGFASVQSGAGRYDLAGYDGLLLRLRGDGRRYGFNARMLNPFNALRYEAYFDTEPDHWQRVLIPFAALRPRMFGTWTPGPSVSPRRIRSFGFIIADYQEGPFRLEIERISAYREGQPLQQPG